MATRRTRVAAWVAACAVVIAAISATIVIAGTRQPPVGLKDITYVRDPFTALSVGKTPLSPQQAKEQLEARGMREISSPQRRGRVAVMAATTPRGERVTLVIDLVSGEITGARREGVPHAQGRTQDKMPRKAQDTAKDKVQNPAPNPDAKEREPTDKKR